MKYSEFEAIAKEYGWDFDNDEEPDGWIYVNKDGFVIAISKFIQNYMDLHTVYAGQASGIEFSEEKSFIKACYELAETPLEERIDEKEYYVQLPLTNNNHRTLYLEIGAYGEPFWSHAPRRHFTEQQIKEIDERLWAFAVEVEGEQSE